MENIMPITMAFDINWFIELSVVIKVKNIWMVLDCSKNVLQMLLYFLSLSKYFHFYLLRIVHGLTCPYTSGPVFTILCPLVVLENGARLS